MLAKVTDGHGMQLKGAVNKQYYYEALAFSRHNINLVFDEENVKPDRHTKAPENAGIDPSTMRVSTWYQESTHEDDDPHSPPPNRVRDTFTGVDRMEKDDMLPPLPQRLASPRIRKIKHCKNSIRTQTRCTVLPLTTLAHKHGLIIVDLPSHSV